MYTGIAIALTLGLAFLGDRANRADRKFYDVVRSDDQRLLELALHIRQDLKLIVFLLAGVILMAGVIADKLAG
jgi:hypothetical protein